MVSWWESTFVSGSKSSSTNSKSRGLLQVIRLARQRYQMSRTSKWWGSIRLNLLKSPCRDHIQDPGQESQWHQTIQPRNLDFKGKSPARRGPKTSLPPMSSKYCLKMHLNPAFLFLRASSTTLLRRIPTRWCSSQYIPRRGLQPIAKKKEE